MTQGFPDVAAMSRGFRIYFKGRPTSIGGTSASAPTFAAVIALLNDVRLSQKQPPLGFLNPWLYGKGLAGLDDITVGNNPGCGTQGFNVCMRLGVVIFFLTRSKLLPGFRGVGSSHWSGCSRFWKDEGASTLTSKTTVCRRECNWLLFELELDIPDTDRFLP